MTRARELARLGNPNAITVDANQNVGVGSLTPVSKLDVVGALDVVGIVSATSFSGSGANLTGIANTGNIDSADLTVSGVSTFQGITKVTSTTASTSTATGSLVISGGVGIAGSVHIGENLSVGGTVTYEDITNIDSVGIITARLGIEVQGGVGVTCPDNVKAYWGTGGDLTIYHDGTHNYIKGTTAADTKIIQNGNLLVQSSAGETILRGLQNAQVDLYFNNSKKIETTNTGAIVTGVCTATSFSGDGSGLDNIVSGISLQSDGSWISAGTAATTFNFSGATVSNVSSGISTITIASAGLTTAASTPSSTIATLALSSAQDHKLTTSGIVTVTCSGGTEGDSHTVRITNSGISTVGFSTYFLWPSGAAPVMPTADGAISLISFTIQKVGTTGIGTQLLSGASLNFS